MLSQALVLFKEARFIDNKINMKKIITKKIYGTVALLSYFLISANASAQGGSFQNPIQANSIEAVIAKLLEFVVKVGTVIAVFFVIYSGFLFVKAQGNEAEISKAKSVFFWTIIGALILIGAQVLSSVICNTANQLGAGARC